MALQRVVYTNKQDWKEIRLVDQDSNPSEYGQGILVGPPDLTDLKIKAAKKRLLNNRLVSANMITFPDLNARRRELLILIRETLGLDDQEASKIRRELIGIYQRDFYPEVSNG